MGINSKTIVRQTSHNKRSQLTTARTSMHTSCSTEKKDLCTQTSPYTKNNSTTTKNNNGSRVGNRTPSPTDNDTFFRDDKKRRYRNLSVTPERRRLFASDGWYYFLPYGNRDASVAALATRQQQSQDGKVEILPDDEMRHPADWMRLSAFPLSRSHNSVSSTRVFSKTLLVLGAAKQRARFFRLLHVCRPLAQVFLALFYTKPPLTIPPNRPRASTPTVSLSFAARAL